MLILRRGCNWNTVLSPNWVGLFNCVAYKREGL